VSQRELVSVSKLHMSSLAVVQTLHIDTPFLRTETKGLQCSLLTESFSLINVFVATIVSSSRVAFRILVYHQSRSCKTN
jgi:hypothetical protein